MENQSLKELFKQLYEAHPDMPKVLAKRASTSNLLKMYPDYSDVRTFNNAVYNQTLPVASYNTLNDFYINNK